jgi:hypothetical protein
VTITSQNVVVYAGDSQTVAVTLSDANGDPFTLSASGTVKYRVAQTSHDSDDPEVAKELNGGVVMNGNVAEVTLLSTDTNLPNGIYYHELKVYDLGDVSTAMTGAFVVRNALSMMGALSQGQSMLSGRVTLSVNAVKFP